MPSRVAAWLRRIVCRLRNTLSARSAERNLDRELAAHEALLADDLVRRGVPAAEAASAARRKLGASRIREDHREARSFRLLDDARQDAIYAVRMMRRSPAVSAVVIASLAIGIGANTVAFSVALASAVMIAVALAAAWFPALRAARVSPIVALREG